jgi:perosamine synthetase
VLAIHGGPVAVANLPVGPPKDPQVRQAMLSSYEDGSWGRYHGPHAQELGDQLARLHHCEFVLLCCSGTYAVEAALRGLGVGPDDEVLLAGYDFPGNFRAIEAIGARPALVDIQPHGWCLRARELATSATDQTRAVIVTHLHGALVDMKDVMTWAEKRGIQVVEDACQAPGAMIDNRLAGRWGDVGVLSFGGSKLLTAGRGGAIVTSDENIYQRAKIYGQRGNDAFPMSELQATVLLPQIAKLQARNEQRAKAVARLHEGIRDIDWLQLMPPDVPHQQASYYKVGITLDAQLLTEVTRDSFIQAMRAEGAPVDAGFEGFTRRSRRRCRHSDGLKNSRRAAEQTVLVHHPVFLASDEVLDQLIYAFHKMDRALKEDRFIEQHV